MRKRAALMALGIAVAAMSAAGTPAQAAVRTPAQPAVTWTTVGLYAFRHDCVDAGQEYQREGWTAWQCVPRYAYYDYWLQIR